MDNLSFKEYSERASATAQYPANMAIVYPVLGLAGETGEVAEKVKKTIRDHQGNFTPEIKRAIVKELGDALWYINATCNDLGIPLALVAEVNLNKVESRKQQGTIQGNGDDR